MATPVEVKVVNDISESTLTVAKLESSYKTYNVVPPSEGEMRPILARLIGPFPSSTSALTQRVKAQIFFNDGSDAKATASFTLNASTHWAAWPSTIMFTPPDAKPSWVGILYVNDRFFDPNPGAAVQWTGNIPAKEKCYTVGGKNGSWPPSGGLSGDEAKAVKFVLESLAVKALLDVSHNRQKYGAVLDALLERIS